jgi:hypothetical protein
LTGIEKLTASRWKLLNLCKRAGTNPKKYVIILKSLEENSVGMHKSCVDDFQMRRSLCQPWKQADPATA